MKIGVMTAATATAGGHYHETYEKVEGKWQIKTLRLTRLRVDEK
jgi:hypothetical protein